MQKRVVMHFVQVIHVGKWVLPSTEDFLIALGVRLPMHVSFGRTDIKKTVLIFFGSYTLHVR